MFKVGDIVRKNVVDGYEGVVSSSNTYGIVGRVTKSGKYSKGDEFIREVGEFFGTLAAELVLVTEAKSELEQLVDKVNEGQKARGELNNYPGQVDYRYGLGHWDDISWGNEINEYRVKPKPTFEPFKVGKDWLVELKGDNLKVGCKLFAVKEFRLCLLNFNISLESCFTFNQQGPDVFSTRQGLKFIFTVLPSEEYLLPWEDCDKILEALNKAGVK